jgi:ribose 5-phosphate isomerase B
MNRTLYTEQEILRLFNRGVREIAVTDHDIITPAAKDKIKSLGIQVITRTAGTPRASEDLNKVSKFKAFENKTNNTIALGSDHTGFKMKTIIGDYLKAKGFEIIDVGTYSEESCDYPDFALKVAQRIERGEAPYGIMLDATGIPSAITANKVPGIRAATCYNEFSAKSARQHNDANMIVLGAKTLGEETVKSILDVFFSNEFLGDRHKRRLDKITAIEGRYNKKRNE